MKAIDTNIVVRLIARDDPAQVAVAEAAVSGGPMLILPSVLMESEWVLRARYRMERADIAHGFYVICGLETVSVASVEAVALAVSAYVEGGDFADHLHCALAAEAGAAAFVTFDREIASNAGGLEVELLV